MQASLEHSPEDWLERYALGTLPAAETECLEEHLLVCPACQDRLTEMDAYVRAARDAAVIARSGHDGPARRSGFRGFLTTHRMVWAACAAGCLAGLLWIFQIRANTRNLGQDLPVSVFLEALRGGQDTPDAIAPKGRPIVLQADASFLPPLARVELRVVDGSGRLIGTYPGHMEGSSISATVPCGLGEGVYWVRLYSYPSRNDLLREYALRIR